MNTIHEFMIRISSVEKNKIYSLASIENETTVNSVTNLKKNSQNKSSKKNEGLYVESIDECRFPNAVI